MIYGTRVLSNEKRKVCLEFDSGKKVTLNPKESLEFRHKIQEWCLAAVEKYCHRHDGKTVDFEIFNNLYDWEA